MSKREVGIKKEELLKVAGAAISLALLGPVR